MASNRLITDQDIGSGLSIDNDKLVVDLTAETSEVETAQIAAVSTSGDSNEPDTFHDFASNRSDADWTVSPDSVSYSGEPDRVEIAVSEFIDTGTATNQQRVSPILELLKNGVVVATSDSAYIRQNAGDNGGSNSIAYVDHDPGVDPQYQLRSRQGANPDAVHDITLGSASFVAVTKVQVIADILLGGASIISSGSMPSFSPTLPAANGKVVSDNFQDQFSSFNLQVRNTTNAAVDWEALVENVPYASIDNLSAGNYTLQSQDNGDGTHSYLFTSTAPLAAFANISINGNGTNPAGNGTGLSLSLIHI